jgi:quercetin dioxygenase-like cupin family protein
MSIRVIGPIGIRYPVGMLAKGEVVESHEHTFDHVTFCFSGAFRIEAEVNGQQVVAEIFAPRPDKPNQNHVLIKAGVKHKLIALEDNSLYQCVYTHRDTRGEVSDHYTGWPKAYG